METNKTTVPNIIVHVTLPNEEIGQELAESLVKERLAACVNRVQVDSSYPWEGKVLTNAEELLIIKTRESLLEALIEHMRSYNIYMCPDPVIAMPITGGNPQYLEWIKNNTRD